MQVTSRNARCFQRSQIDGLCYVTMTEKICLSLHLSVAFLEVSSQMPSVIKSYAMGCENS